LSRDLHSHYPSENGKWLLVATTDNWKKCLESKSWGVKERYKRTIQRMRVGDEFLVHITGNRTAGICEVTREYYYDNHPTWDDGNLYPHRIGLEPVKIPAEPIDAKASYDKHLRETHRTSGGYFGNPIRQLSDFEFSIFESDIDKNLATTQMDKRLPQNTLESSSEKNVEPSIGGSSKGELSSSDLRETITYQDIVRGIGGRKIQQGMNYRVNGKYSIFLVNTSSMARYDDRYEGGILIYEGHDIPARIGANPKNFDQPERNKNGSLTTNGKFFEAATKYKSEQTHERERIQVYEKREKNVWIDRGFFFLVDGRKEKSNGRLIFKFVLVPEMIEQVSEKEIDKAIAMKDNYIVKEILATESRRIATVRNGQSVIRKHTLENYSNQCAMCDIDDPGILVASHIIPWSEDKSTRGVLENVICLCVLHDALFEQGKITINYDYTIEFSDRFLHRSKIYSLAKQITKTQLRMPKNVMPSKKLLIKHRIQAQ